MFVCGLRTTGIRVVAGAALCCAWLTTPAMPAPPADPGVRNGSSGAGGPVAGLTIKESKFFSSGQDDFGEASSVTGTVPNTDAGLGPRFNSTSCASCHAFPEIGGSSPATNPQVSLGPPTQVAALVTLGIISQNGPVREVRFKSDGGVHDLFTISGRTDNPAGCSIAQPDFATHKASGDVIFRIPTPTFGNGLIEAIAEETIRANELAPKPFGIGGRANRNGNDGTITRFGWKAQNKSLAIFAGEAYNVEQGITNELFPDERGESGVPDPAACRVVPTPQDTTHYDLTQPQQVPSDVISFANFMRFLAPPTPSPSGYTATNGSTTVTVSSTSISAGQALFATVGCAACHMPSMPTGNHSSTALANQTANLYSDLLVHNMGALGDGISQGIAGPNEFRTAPLWGLGKRIFFLHDGSTSDLLEAISKHAANGTDPASEANTVIQRFNARTDSEKQDILNFLRSL